MKGLEFFTYYMLEKGVDPDPVLENIGRSYSGMLAERFAGFSGSILSVMIVLLGI